jgi:2-succinyl-5-enolpyruvyl-6-hydroxy-3-cyclohexene-1-carboxylate synthase
MFREPLEPLAQRLPKSYLSPIIAWERSKTVYTAYKKYGFSTDGSDLQELASMLNMASKGLIVCGQLNSENEKKAVINLAAHLKWPVVADINSGIRNSDNPIPVLHHFDQILLSRKWQKILIPETILHIGSPLTSKRYLKTIERLAPKNYIHVAGHNSRQDPVHRVRLRCVSGIEEFCNNVSNTYNGNVNKQWYVCLYEIDSQIRDLLARRFSDNELISEISLAWLTAKNFHKDHGLFLASSMPVRDFDMYCGVINGSSHVNANRGASGIDGTLSSAAGFARGIGKPTTVVLGDLAFIHDLNSCSLTNSSPVPLTIIVINNHGGGIFSFLPIAEYSHVFEKYFGTPHDYSFEYIARMFKINYFQPKTNGEFVKIYNKCLGGKKTSLIEIQTDRQKNYEFHIKLQSKIKSLLEK